MTHPHLPHAQHVVKTFKSKLSEQELAHFDDSHFDELELLVESAISTAVLYEIEHAADQVEKLSSEMRKKAEHI